VTLEDGPNVIALEPTPCVLKAFLQWATRRTACNAYVVENLLEAYFFTTRGRHDSSNDVAELGRIVTPRQSPHQRQRFARELTWRDPALRANIKRKTADELRKRVALFAFRRPIDGRRVLHGTVTR
jgi:hypothetical protein